MFFVILIINKSYQSSRNQTENEKICAVGGRLVPKYKKIIIY